MHRQLDIHGHESAPTAPPPAPCAPEPLFHAPSTVRGQMALQAPAPLIFGDTNDPHALGAGARAFAEHVQAAAKTSAAKRDLAPPMGT